MNAIAAALAPILALILVGFVLRSRDFVPVAAWAGIEKITYYVLFPALLVHSLGNRNFAGTAWPAMLLVVTGTLFAAGLALIAWHWLRGVVSGPTFTSIFQGGVRFNTYIALAVAQGFFGAEGLALAAVAAGLLIVLINLLCIWAFSVWGDPDRLLGLHPGPPARRRYRDHGLDHHLPDPVRVRGDARNRPAATHRIQSMM